MIISHFLHLPGCPNLWGQFREETENADWWIGTWETETAHFDATESLWWIGTWKSPNMQYNNISYYDVIELNAGLYARDDSGEPTDGTYVYYVTDTEGKFYQDLFKTAIDRKREFKGYYYLNSSHNTESGTTYFISFKAYANRVVQLILDEEKKQLYRTDLEDYISEPVYYTKTESPLKSFDFKEIVELKADGTCVYSIQDTDGKIRDTTLEITDKGYTVISRWSIQESNGNPEAIVFEQKIPYEWLPMDFEQEKLYSIVYNDNGEEIGKEYLTKR